jgi:type IV secretion system protein VirD4
MSSADALPSVPWSAGRKLAAVVFALAAYAGLACAAVYLSGVLFLLLNKANPSQARFSSIARYWRLYADDPPLRKTLQVSMAVSAA